MTDATILDVSLYDRVIGTITLLPGDRSLFAFTDGYINDPARFTLGQSFTDVYGLLIDTFPPVQTRVEPFFANMLPEGHLRQYLAARAGVKDARAFFLLAILGRDLPGAVTITSAGTPRETAVFQDAAPPAHTPTPGQMLRFSLAGVQLKFSALKDDSRNGGLTIPANGAGGSWIVKLPSTKHEGVPENEFAMMTLASRLGMDVPAIKLVDVADVAGLPADLGALHGKAFAIRRFDRSAEGAVHSEDFAQVFNVYPEAKYEKATYRRIAKALSIATDEASVAEFVRRMIFNTLIGNGDMHLKNWSLIYADRYTPALSPAYDFVSTIPYIPNDRAALKYARTNSMQDLDDSELSYFAAKALIPEHLVLSTARHMVGDFLDLWHAEKRHLDVSSHVITAIDQHLSSLKIVTGRA